MNKRSLFISLLLCFTLWSCESDDVSLWNEISTTKNQLVQINQNVDALQKLVDAQKSKKTISTVETLSDSYKIKFNDGEALTIKTDDDAPIVGIGMSDGSYYWTLGGNDQWILDDNNQKVEVLGHSPQLSVDDEGYWLLDDRRLKDAAGTEIKALGGDTQSLFKEVYDNEENHQVLFKLTNGTTITLPKSLTVDFSFKTPEEGQDAYQFMFGEMQTFNVRLDNIKTLDIMKASTGWVVSFDRENNQVHITAPMESDDMVYSKGVITIVGIDTTGKTMLASVSVCASLDFTDKDGAFVLCEGNMTSANGSLIFFDGKGKEHKDVFEKANGQLEIGNVFQDMYIANDRIYLLTQNGSNMGGAGRYVVCDANTMKKLYASSLEIETPDGNKVWPQHLVIVSKDKGYIQYAQRGMEKTSGICEIKLKGDTAIVKNTVEGTFGTFAVEGATKTRLIYSKGKVYAACGNSVIIIDPENNAIVKRIKYDKQQVKGIVKGADGNIYFALSASFTGTPNAPTFTGDPAQIIGIDPEGNVLQEVNVPTEVTFPVATWTPTINMGASFKEPYLYFVDSKDWGAATITRYNYSTKKFSIHYANAASTVYGIMGVHPKTEELWVGTTMDYLSSDIKIYSTKEDAMAKLLRTYKYSSDKYASPAAIDFPYRFSADYINK